MSSPSEPEVASDRRGPPPSTPRRLGDYEVLFELAAGGTASVFVGRQVGDAGFERLVALKRVHRHLLADPEIYAMASDEARLAALIHHPNVVSVAGVIDAGGELVLVQDYVEGTSLAVLQKRLRERGEALPPAVASKIAIDAARGLHAAHEVRDLRGEPLGLVHRDVSPQNLLVGADGTTRMIDFGIARAERRMTLTKTGIIKGKLQYMAPEQIEERPLDRRADVFALAAVLYEMIAGKRPFGEGSESAMMGRVLLGEVDLEPIRAVSDALAKVIEGALAKDREARPATALELARRVGKALPPADEEAVVEVVEQAAGESLRAVRAQIAASLGEEEDDLLGEEEAPAAAAAPREEIDAPASAIAVATATRSGRRSRLVPSLIVAGLGVAALAGLVVLASASSSPASPSSSTARAATGTATATASTLASASARAEPYPSREERVTATSLGGVGERSETGVGIDAPVSASSSSASSAATPTRMSRGHGSATPLRSGSAEVPRGTAPSGELMPSPYRHP